MGKLMIYSYFVVLCYNWGDNLVFVIFWYLFLFKCMIVGVK